MRATLVWLGDVIGGFCAAVVVYVIAGSLVGRAIVIWNGRIINTIVEGQPCWPQYSPIGFYLHLKVDSAVGLLWFAVVAVPSVIVEFPALVVRHALIELWPALASDPMCFAVDDWIVTFAPALFMLFSVAGLIYWYDRARLCAQLLSITLATQIVAIAVFG